MVSKLMLFLALTGPWCITSLPAQDAQRSSEPANQPAEHQEKRLFGIIPNYRTSPSLVPYQPLTTREKFKLASQDALDRGTFLLAAGFAGLGQLTNSNPTFGQGVEGYSHYFVTSYADWAVGDYMTEAVFPAVFHQDPRYFRNGTGNGFKRLTYAMGQIFWTHTDAGGHMVNISEIGGNAAAVAISQSYYPAGRDAGSAGSKFVVQIGVDMASNVMKEFYPDLVRRFSKKRQKTTP